MFPDYFHGKRLVVGSVAYGPFVNRGNALIERETFRLLGLDFATPRFSVFERLTEDAVTKINGFDVLLITGCTTLQDDPEHQVCFDERFRRIAIPKICFGAAFCCDRTAQPSLRVAEMFELPIGARDPWTHEYLSRHGFRSELIGCPTLLTGPSLADWVEREGGRILVSSTPPLDIDIASLSAGGARAVEYISHSAASSGRDICEEDLFDGVATVLTGRLHAALPALARGSRVRFFAPDYGVSRFSLLEFLGVPTNGDTPSLFPATQINFLKRNCLNWMRDIADSIERRRADGGTSATGPTDGGRLDALEAEVLAMRDSLSWRITAPARAVAARFPTARQQVKRILGR